MKNLKNIIIIFGVIFFGVISEVKAEVVSSYREIPGATIDVKGNGVQSPISINFLENSSMRTVYSLNPLDYSFGKDFTMLDSENTYSNYNMSEDVYNTIKEIMFFGVDYIDRTSWDWYAATQILIWKTLFDGELEITINSSKKATYESYMNTILEDIRNLKSIVYPSFFADDEEKKDLVVKVYKDLVLEDTNGVINDFEIKYNNNYGTSRINNNSVILNYTYPITDTITFWPKSVRKLGYSANIYVENEKILFMDRGELNIDKKVNVKVENPFIHLKIRDVETKETVLGGQYYLKRVGLNDGYDVQINNVEDLKVEVIKSSYDLVEVKTPYGYKPYLNEENLEVLYDDIEFEMWYEPIKKAVNIEALEDMMLELYKDNVLIDSFNIKANEVQSYDLRYGNYELKKINKTRGIGTNVKFVVDENYDESKTIIVGEDDNTLEEVPVPDEIIIENKREVNIQIVDAVTGDLILKEASFRIKNKVTGEYLINGKTDVFKTINGIISINDLPIGVYVIEQVEAPLGYRKAQESGLFTIDKDNVTLNVVIYQVKESGSITIKRIDGLSLEGIPGVLFAIYNQDKELLFEMKTNEEGLIELNNLDIGKYYIKEVLDGNLEFDTLAREVTVKDNINSIITFSDRIKVSVPKTDSYSYVNVLSGGCLALGFMMVRRKNESA